MESELLSLYRSPEGYAATMAEYKAVLARWPLPYKSHHVPTRHGMTHLLITGAEHGPPLFLFHGWIGNAAEASQEYDLRVLGQQYRLYIPDTIGQRGYSAPTRPPTDGSAYGEWIADMFDELAVEQSYVAGISGGGYLSLKIASFAPQRVQRVLVISPAGIIPPAFRLRLLLGGVPVMIYPTPTTARWFVRALSSPATKPELVEEFSQSILLKFKHHKYDRSFPAPLSDDELGRITAPVLILMGEHDISWDVGRLTERARRYIPHAQVEAVPNAGHAMTRELSGKVERRMLEFFTTSKDAT